LPISSGVSPTATRPSIWFSLFDSIYVNIIWYPGSFRPFQPPSTACRISKAV
jgi:hypothetical protein